MVEGQGRGGNIWGPLRQWQAVCHGWHLGTVDMLIPTALQMQTPFLSQESSALFFMVNAGHGEEQSA